MSRAGLFRVGLFLILTILPVFLSATEIPADVTIIRNDFNSFIFEWSPRNLTFKEITTNDGKFRQPQFDNGITRNTAGHPDLPWREFTIGASRDSRVQVRVISSESNMVADMRIAPVPYVYHDRSGMTSQQYVIKDSIYSQNRLYPENVIAVSAEQRFRDIPIRKISITPFQYNPGSGELIIFKRIRVRVDYNHRPGTVSAPFRPQGKLDKLYDQMLLNFDQARNWQIKRRPSLKKSTVLPGGTWYRITVREEGLYRINAGTLSSSGISLNSLPIDAIQMFNNGGHMLNPAVNAGYYNPDHTMEIPIQVVDVNQNGMFEGNDYILFYGKNVNGWFFDDRKNDFIFQQHVYATENYYWLTVSGSNGLRMTRTTQNSGGGSALADYFYDRYHFEEELYNLLASGPDWYGYRFFGRSDSYNQGFTITTNQAAGAQPEFIIQLKGGAGVKYGDDLRYRYDFRISLNNQVIFSDISFAEESRRLYSKKLSSPQILVNGANTLSIQYSGNLDGCIAHLDWFELFYPRGFEVKDNFLRLFTKDYKQAMRYNFTGFSNVSDVCIYDVSDPVNPQILAENLSPAAGAIEFDLDASASPRELLVCSVTSPSVKVVSSLSPYSPGQDLLSTSNQADYLVITHKTFVPYAEQLAARRSYLSHKVVTMEDIYFQFNAGVPDPLALRNFIRYAYNNWQQDAPSYVLLFGDAHYDYRNINLPDTMRVPTYEIYHTGEIDSRLTDNLFVDLDFNSSTSFNSISPDLAIGRLPMESTQDAQRMLDKIIQYEDNPNRDGWQTIITMVADDNKRPGVTGEYLHQNQTEEMARLSELAKFNIKKIYLSTYPSAPGGFGEIKPEAARDVVDMINQGTLIINYVGHGSPTQWAHEAVFVMDRDLGQINNDGKLSFLIAATCDFGKFDDPHEPSFTEALIWEKDGGIVGALASTRLVFSQQNARFNRVFYTKLFPNGRPSISLGEAKLLATQSNINDQKYVLFADPTMHLADPREKIEITSISPDTLKALSKVEVRASVMVNGEPGNDFNGGAFMIVNDASYDSVDTGGGFDIITLPGPQIFKGEISVSNGQLDGRFIVPKSIRYSYKERGRVTLYAWDEGSSMTALGFNNNLLLNGSTANISDSDGPEMDIFFKDQENFTSGDLVGDNAVLMAELADENGINITGEAGHNISLLLDDNTPKDISGFFSYEKDSFTKGFIKYPLGTLQSGQHTLTISAFDNLNNSSEQQIEMVIAGNEQIVLQEVVNYPNPFRNSTQFTFQTNRDGARVQIKIYTISGRLIKELEGISVQGYNSDISWDGRDEDGDDIANGVYLYKLMLDDNENRREVIEKLVILR